MNKKLCAGILAALLLGTLANVQATPEQDLQLIDAAKDGDLVKVKELIAAGADVNAKDDDGWTALMYAAEKGYTEIIEILKAAGAKE